MFGRSKRFIKYRVCPLFLCVVLFSFTIPFVSAAEYSGSGYVNFSQYRVASAGGQQLIRNIGETRNLPFSNVMMAGDEDGNATYRYGSYGLNTVSVPDGEFTKPTSIYFSCFTQFGTNVTHYRPSWLIQPFEATFYGSFTDPDTGIVNSNIPVGISTFEPVTNQVGSNFGVILDAHFEPSELQPAKNISINSEGNLFLWDNTTSYPAAPVIQIVSFRVVTSDTSAELEGLEAIADQIVAQSEMMSAFYGDIVAICNQIYSRLGDMEATLELANVYFQQMIALLQSIDTTTTNIYNLLPTQFALLETAINTANHDIVSAVQDQTDALITYFDSVFSGAVGNLPEKSEDLETNIGNVGSAENEYKSNASATFEQLSSEFTGFTGGTLSGIALASNLFTQVWNALGDYSVVYSFPLLFGLCLLLIGRLSKHSGGQSSTDKERGDSDA